LIFRTTRQADEDISDLFVYGVLNFGHAQATAYEAGLFRVFDLLSNNPFMVRERSELRPPVRLHPYRSHLIVYMVGQDHILIVRVLHSRQDWDNLLA
jgi:toxin ParE1/3/4